MSFLTRIPPGCIIESLYPLGVFLNSGADRPLTHKESTVTTTKLIVPDMSCAHCELTIRETLSPLAGIEQVTVDLPSKSVTVNYDPDQINVDQMSQALAEESYPVSATELVAAS